MTQNCVESFLEVSLKATSVQRPTTEPEEETEEEALAGRTRVGGGGVGGRRTDCYGADGEIITLNFKQQHHPQKQRDSGPDGGFQEENGGGFANKILTERKLRQLYKGEDFPPTIEKTKLKGSPKKQPQFTGSCSSSPAAIRKAASAAPRATTAATAEAVAAAFAGTAATPSKRQQTPPVPKKNNGNNKRMPLSSQENTQQQEEEGETDSPVTKPAAASGAPGAGYCKGAMADKMSDLAARFGKQNSSPEIVNKATSKVKHVRRAHSDDIKGRVAALENAMTKTKFVTVTERPTMDKNDPNYGKPEEGTKTAERGKKAHSHVHKEILELCEVIYMNGFEQADHTAIMFFGDLFRLYTRISDKVVGILLRAKKYGLVYFEPEILFQGQDDETPVFLAKSMQEIYLIYNENKGFVMPN